MAFVNLPPNLQDIFYSITDRVAKLETGPNQAMYTAESAQGSAASAQSAATAAQIQAANALVTANQAAAQATIAQSQATIASTQATTALATANGKNKVTYSTSAPGATANTLGDIWYQYGTSGVNLNKVIAQWSGAGGTSWTSVTITGLVIANIDAGAITTGTLSAITISAGSGATSFNVSSTGVMSAQGVYVKGNIVADSGTFTGTVNAGAGYFGSSSNGWTIGSTGLTGIGTGSITGGSITTTSGRIGGWYLDSGGLTSVNGAFTGYYMKTDGTASFGLLNATGFQMVSAGAITMGLGTISGASTISGGTLTATTGMGTVTLNVTGAMTYPGIATGAGTSMVLVSTGSRVAIVTSSERFKQDIKYITTNGWLDKVLAMRPITYKTDIDYTTEGEPNETQVGFLAEDINDIGGDLEKAVVFDPLGDPFSLSYDRLTVFLTLAIKEIDARLKTLEGK